MRGFARAAVTGRNPGPGPHRRRERGAVLVEFALMSLVLVTLAMGVLEIGAAWNDHQSVTQASRSGARVGSQLGVEGNADVESLLAIDAALGDLGDDVTRIVMFEADGNGNMPTACETATAGYSGAANCNVYDTTHLSNLTTTGWWGSGTSCGTADANWCPATERADDLSTATYLGIHIEIQRSYLTGIFGGGTQRLSETTVMRVEPPIE